MLQLAVEVVSVTGTKHFSSDYQRSLQSLRGRRCPLLLRRESACWDRYPRLERRSHGALAFAAGPRGRRSDGGSPCHRRCEAVHGLEKRPFAPVRAPSAKNCASVHPSAASIFLSDATEGLTRFCSIIETAPLVTPARRANSRCDIPHCLRRRRTRVPTSVSSGAGCSAKETSAVDASCLAFLTLRLARIPGISDLAKSLAGAV